MRIIGIIAEYNPFHNGHRYQILNSREQLDADAVVCVMSGNFVQRGDMAIADKWVRAEMALKSGADLVIELPCCFALNTAEIFAYGGVALINSLGIINNLVFGCEDADLNMLERVANLLSNEPEELSNLIKYELDKGIGYPQARCEAVSKITGISKKRLSSPNNILAIEYLRALNKLDSKIIPYAIKREGVGYHDNLPNGEFASATAIRKMIRDKESVENYMPQASYDVLNSAIQNGAMPVFTENLDNAVLAKIRIGNSEDFENISDVAEGLHLRICNMAMKATSIDELIDMVTTKRYTRARVARIIWSMVLGIEAKNPVPQPNYIRVLGMNDIGKKVLSIAKKKSSLPIITKFAKFDGNDELLKFDMRATDLYSLAYPDKKRRIGNLDYTTSPVVITNKNERHFVYILECGDGTLYTGWTNNLEQRINAHNSGNGAKYTKAHGGGELVYFEEFENKSEALKRECDIKKLSRKKKLELIESKKTTSNV